MKSFGFAAAMLLSAASAQAATVTYVLPDIGTFQGYTTNDTSLTFAGNGYVGMYETDVNGEDQWVHLFGLEDGNYSRTVGQVNLSALSGATINSAIFSFDLLDGCDPCSQQVTFSYFVENGALDYNWSPVALGSTTFTATGNGPNSVDVTSLVAAFAGSGNAWFGFHLAGTDAYQYTYTSGTGGDDANVRLTVVYDEAQNEVPEPTSLALMGTALAGLVLRQRRRR